MIENNGFDFEVECDFCSNHEDTCEEEFADAIEYIKARGWAVFKDNTGNWRHKCPTCRKSDTDEDMWVK